MEKFWLPLAMISLVLVTSASGGELLPADVIKTSSGDLVVTFIGHGSLMFTFGGKVIHVDPYSKLADYGNLPKADIILITHEHRDHLDPAAIEQLRTAGTLIVLTGIGAKQLGSGLVMKNGDVRAVGGFMIEAVPAYNLIHKRDSGEPFHLKGNGNGYVVIFGDKRVYIAGDTENVPEMRALSSIDIAFLPMNLPYTMTPEMVADAVKMFKPKVLYPYHTGETDVAKLTALLKDQKDTEVRIRSMK